MPPKIAAACAPVPVAGHCWPLSPQETLKASQAGLAPSAVGVTAHFPGSWCIEGFVCALQASLSGMRFYFKLDCAPPTFCFVLGYGVLLFLVGSNVLLFSFVQQLVVILVFLQEKMGTCPSTLPSWREKDFAEFICVCVCVCVCVFWSWVYLLFDQFFFSLRKWWEDFPSRRYFPYASCLMARFSQC